MKGDPDKSKRTPNRDGLYVDSTLAINPDTGKLVWYYQHLPQDYWDLDFAFEQTIATMNIKGKPTKVVCSTGKMVWTDAWMRPPANSSSRKTKDCKTLSSPTIPRRAQDLLRSGYSRPQRAAPRPAMLCRVWGQELAIRLLRRRHRYQL